MPFYVNQRKKRTAESPESEVCCNVSGLDESLQKKFPYFEGTYEVFDVPHTDFQIRYQPEQILAASGRKILTGTAFLCRRENERCLMLPSRYEKVDVEDFIREHLFFYDDAEMRHVGVALSEVA